MRSYEELISADPAWPELEAAARKSGRVTILPRDTEAARLCLENLQVTTRSTLGALAHETGGLLVDHGWLRLFGSGHERLRRALGAWNETLGIPMSDFLLVADDAVGGAFAMNGTALGSMPSNIFYFAPDSLAWEDMQIGYSAFVHWAFEGDLGSFYETMRWPGWENEIEQLGGDQALSLVPPSWTREGKDLSKVFSPSRFCARRLGPATRDCATAWASGSVVTALAALLDAPRAIEPAGAEVIAVNAVVEPT